MPEQLDAVPFQADHIVALKHGGPTEGANLAWACNDCNSFKGPNVAAIDPETNMAAKLFHPRLDRWSEHFRWQAGLMVASSPVGRVTINVLRINLHRRVVYRLVLRARGEFPF